MDISNQIKTRREAMGLSQEQLAEKLYVSRTRCIWIAAGRSWWIRCSIMPNVSDAPRRILWLRTAAIVRRMQCMGGI